MWYWIKNPATGEWLDLSHDQLRQAVRNRSVEKDWPARKHTHKRWKTAGELMDEEPELSTEPSDDLRPILIDCVGCKVQLRFSLLVAGTTLSCPKCRTTYRILRSAKTETVIFVVAEPSQTGDQANRGQRPRRAMSQEVRAAFAFFKLPEAAEVSDLKTKYRDLLKAYHPDTVASLAPEFRAVAEEKTKQINKAFAVIVAYLSESA